MLHLAWWLVSNFCTENTYMILYKKYTYYILLTITIVLLVVASFLIVKNFQYLHGRGAFRNPSQMRAPLTDANTIKSWMTFSFVNRSFALPNDYLKQELSITNKNYPNVTIREVSKALSKNEIEFLQQIKDSVTNYLASKKTL